LYTVMAYGPDGTCGKQHNNTLCLPLETRGCCSINGCFTSYGRQSGCIDPPAFYLNTSPASTFSTVTATATATTTATPIPAPALNTQQKTGIIVGVILFVFAIVIAVLFFCHKRRKTTPAVRNNMIRWERREANGTVETLEIPQATARQYPQLMGMAMANIGAGASRGGFLGFGGPGSTARYLDDGDDSRIRDLSSERGD